MSGFILALTSSAITLILGCSGAKKTDESALTPVDARSIAKEAFLYGFPMAANYQTMYSEKNQPLVGGTV